jgi:PAS domain S-box-containing protein
MRISVKLTAGVLVIAAIVALVGYLTNLTNQTIQTQVEHLSRSSLIQVVDAADMALAIQAGHDGLHDLIARERRQKRSASTEAQDNLDRLRHSVQATLASFQRSLDHSRQASQSLDLPANDAVAAKQAHDVSERFKPLGAAFAVHHRLVTQCLRLIDTDPTAAEELLDEQLDPHFNNVLFPKLSEQKHNAESEFSREVHSIERAVAAANVRNTTATLLALLFALVMGLFLARSIGVPLAELKTAALQIGKGRLDTRLANRSRDEIGMLAATFNRMAEDLQATTVSKAYVDNILESMSEMLIVTDSALTIRLVNGAALAQLGFTADELIGRPLPTLLGPRLESAASLTALEILRGTRELSLTAKNGRVIPVHWAGSELHGAEGELQGLVCAALNIAERKETEERLRASLDEKEVLLKEVHHRVKNNLQIISSLLALQARDNGDPQVRRMFEQSQGRIRSMALIHEQLYQSGELSRIDFLEYVRRLCSYLMECSDDLGARVALRLDVAAVPLPLNLAIPCGMILNELVSNALKHAFPAGRRGTVSIGFAAHDGQFRLSVRDDGVGTDPAAAPAKSGSLGLKVVDALVKQLGGALTIINERGAQFDITFAVPNEGSLRASVDPLAPRANGSIADEPQWATAPQDAAQAIAAGAGPSER